MADIDSDDGVALTADITMIDRLSETDDPPDISELADAAEDDGLERDHAVEFGDVTMVGEPLEHGPPVERAEDAQPEEQAGAVAESSLVDALVDQGYPPGLSKVTQHAKDADPNKELASEPLVPHRDDEFYYRLTVVQVRALGSRRHMWLMFARRLVLASSMCHHRCSPVRPSSTTCSRSRSRTVLATVARTTAR
jgi:hypothetical protein